MTILAKAISPNITVSDMLIAYAATAPLPARGTDWITEISSFRYITEYLDENYTAGSLRNMSKTISVVAVA